MRKLVLMAVLAGLLAVPLFAQFGIGFGGGGGVTLLTNKSVQEEIKMTEAQKEKAQEVVKTIFSGFKGFKKGDKEGAEKRAKETEAAINKFKDEVLKPEQKKRLTQIEIQQAGLRAFTRDDVQKELKLSDKQKDDIKELSDEIQRDVGELSKGLFKEKDKEKREEVTKKLTKVRAEGMDKVTKLLTGDQKKAWTEMTGTPFEVKFEAGAFPGFGKGKGKDKDKDK